MALVKMKAPEGVVHATLNGVPVASSDDGVHIEVPGFALAEAKAQGFTFVDPKQDAEIDVKADLDEQPDHHLANFLAAHRIPHHRYEFHTHIYSQKMRDIGELFVDGPSRTVELTTTAGSLKFKIANPADTLHQMKVMSNLVPDGTRIQVLEHSTGEGEFSLPEGVDIVAIKGGTDKGAQVIVSVTGAHIADHLDSYHSRFHEKGLGRIVFLTREEMLTVGKQIVDLKATAAKA